MFDLTEALRSLVVPSVESIAGPEGPVVSRVLEVGAAVIGGRAAADAMILEQPAREQRTAKIATATDGAVLDPEVVSLVPKRVVGQEEIKDALFAEMHSGDQLGLNVVEDPERIMRLNDKMAADVEVPQAEVEQPTALAEEQSELEARANTARENIDRLRTTEA